MEVPVLVMDLLPATKAGVVTITTLQVMHPNHRGECRGFCLNISFYTTLPGLTSSSLMYPPFPDVKLKKLPFYHVITTLMKPCALQPSGNARFQEQKFSFYLSPSQTTEIAESACRDAHGRVDYRKQIQVRFSLQETSCEQDDNFPASICVKVRVRTHKAIVMKFY